MNLYRATSRTSPYFGPGTCWAATHEHAERYTQTEGFGGPTIYVVTVDIIPSEVLDLTANPFAVMAERGIELGSQGDGEWLPAEIIRLGELFGSAWGHRWWLFDVDEPGVCWLYLGAGSLPATRIADKPLTNPGSFTPHAP
jgi:hypothetical protein